MRSYLVDVNVWVALAYDLHAHNTVATSWYESIESGGALFCRFTQLGFLRLITNPRVMGKDARSLMEAWRLYDSLCTDPRVDFVPEPLDLEVHLRALTQRAQVSSKVWSDAYLTAFAKARNLALVSFDRVFQHVPGVETRVLRPT